MILVGPGDGSQSNPALTAQAPEDVSQPPPPSSGHTNTQQRDRPGPPGHTVPPIVNRDVLAWLKHNQRTRDAAMEAMGAWVDSKVQSVEQQVDDGRAWLRKHGGVGGQAASDQIGFSEGTALSVYDTGKGLVQTAYGAQQLTDPMEWVANPQANLNRLTSTINTLETTAKVARIADPTSWLTDPQGNAKTVSALWHGGVQSFQSDPSKFLGNVTATVGTLFIPGADAAGAVGDAGKAARVAETSDLAAGPVSLMRPGDAFLQNASRRVDVDPNGVFDVVAHGTPQKIEVQTPKGPVLIDHRVAARLIAQSKGYNGQSIRLLACSTGSSVTGFAQNLANKLGVEVSAPSDILWAKWHGGMFVAAGKPSGLVPGAIIPDYSRSGSFRTFTPWRP